jgi:hypothetical protein
MDAVVISIGNRSRGWPRRSAARRADRLPEAARASFRFYCPAMTIIRTAVSRSPKACSHPYARLGSTLTISGERDVPKWLNSIRKGKKHEYIDNMESA